MVVETNLPPIVFEKSFISKNSFSLFYGVSIKLKLGCISTNWLWLSYGVSVKSFDGLVEMIEGPRARSFPDVKNGRQENVPRFLLRLVGEI